MDKLAGAWLSESLPKATAISSMASHITELPEELLIAVLSYITNHHELCDLQKVSRTFKRVASDESLWKEAFCRETEIDCNSTTFWKDIFVYFHGLTHKVRKLLVDREQLRMDVQDLQTMQEHYRNESNEFLSQIRRLKEHEEQSIHQKLRIADELRVCKEIMEELSQELRNRDDQLADIYDQKKELERQLNSELEHCKSLKKEITEYRELWEKEVFILFAHLIFKVEEAARLKRDAKHKEKQIEKLEETGREKSKEVSK